MLSTMIFIARVGKGLGDAMNPHLRLSQPALRGSALQRLCVVRPYIDVSTTRAPTRVGEVAFEKPRVTSKNSIRIPMNTIVILLAVADRAEPVDASPGQMHAFTHCHKHCKAVVPFPFCKAVPDQR